MKIFTPRSSTRLNVQGYNGYNIIKFQCVSFDFGLTMLPFPDTHTHTHTHTLNFRDQGQAVMGLASKTV